MPYPNEHACRLREPGAFQPDSFRRTQREHEGKPYSVIMGRLKNDDAMTEQAYRYAKDTWTAGQARSHCEDHDGSFEPASNEQGAMNMNRYRTLLQERQDLIAEAKGVFAQADQEDRDLTLEERARDDEINARLTVASEEIGREERRREWERTAPAVTPERMPAQVRQEPEKFRSLGDMLIAVKNFAFGHVDPRLMPLATSLGQNEAVGSEGGFLIGTEQVPGLDKKIFASGVFTSRVTMRTLAAGTNSADFYGRDEDSRATGSRFGGVRGYRVAEGAPITPAAMKFWKYTLKPEKYAALVYVTDEMLRDSALIEQEIMEAAPQELAFMLDDDIMNGLGAGYPLGILNSAARVVVAKKTGQAAGTITAQNVIEMWARRWVKGSYTWFINQDVLPQLYQLNLAVGVGGQLIFMPPGGLSQAPYATLLGAPVIETEFNATLGTEGDIVLADLSQYKVARAGSAQFASSPHVAFLTDQMAYRFTDRYDGLLTWKAALTPYKGGGNTISPVVVLAVRA